jgi:exosortase
MAASAAFRIGWSTALFGFALLFPYWSILVELVREWGANENYSHGYVIVPAAAYLVWLRRRALAQLPAQPSLAGLVLVGAGIAMLLAGTAGIELFLTRVSIVVGLAGSLVFVLGWAHLKALAFPLGLLLLAIPLPAIVFNQIALPLQLLATKVGVGVLQFLEIPVLREGNVIVLATTTLEIAEACSGIRSLISLVTLALLFGYVAHPGWMARTAIALSSIPTAILANGLRVAGTGAAAHYYGEQAASGFFHSFSGWLVFIAAFAMVVVVERVVRVVTSGHTAMQPAPCPMEQL